MSNLILRSIKNRGEKIFARIRDQIRNDRLRSLYIFTGIIIVVVASYLIWLNFFHVNEARMEGEQEGSGQISQVLNTGENFLARISTGISRAFADMFGVPNENIVAEFPIEGRNARERQSAKGDAFVFIDKNSSYLGGEIIKSGSGFTLNGEVIIFFSSPLGENKSVAVFANQSGQFNYTHTVHLSAEEGIYHYWAEDKATGFVTDRIRYLIVSASQKNITSAQVAEILTNANEEDDREPSSLALPKECSFSGAGRATGTKRIVLNEVAWMGSTEHHTNEWIELKNISSFEVDVSGWWLIDQAEQIKEVFPQNTIIPAGRFLLLERTDDDSVPNVRADMIYTGILSNDEEGLRLLSPNCLIQDEVLADPKWPAGEASSRKTMERKADLSGWQTSVFVGGTPKQRNSSGKVVLAERNITTENAVVATDVSGVLKSGISGNNIMTTNAGVGGSQANITNPPALTPPALCSQTNLSNPSKTILLNEIAWMGNSVSSFNEWIELYNPGKTTISLAGWQLLDEKENIEDIKIFFDEGDNIPAGEYFLVLRSRQKINFIPGVQADKFYTGAINDSDETLRLFNNNCALVDEVIAIPNWIAGERDSDKTMERKAGLSGWQTSALTGGTPGQKNSSGKFEGSQATAALQCSFSTAGVAIDPKQVILNEIAWMGSDCPNRRECSNNEWIELKNISSSDVDISGWRLIDQENQIRVLFPQNTKISADGFFLLERTNDDSVPNIPMDMFYRGGLSDTNEGLRLLNPDCLIQDEALASPNWPAGELINRKTMERRADLSGWQTSAVVNGTPRQKNFDR